MGKKKEYDKERYQKNKEKILEQHKRYRKENKEKILEQNKRYYKENKEKILEKNKRYRKKNKEKILEQTKGYYKENKEKISEQHKRYYQENKEKIKEQNKRHYQENRERINKQQAKRKKTKYHQDTNYKIRQNLRIRLRKAVKGANKSARTMELLGCSIEQLRTHIEAQFTDGMTWDNHGLKGWHIDHIRPCASFDLTDPQQQLECFHYTNLQPLWAEDNLKKSGKYDRTTD